jgi:hypothetical protein
MLDEIEREFEGILTHSISVLIDSQYLCWDLLDLWLCFIFVLAAATSGLKELKINAHTVKDDVDDKEQGKKLLSLLW